MKKSIGVPIKMGNLGNHRSQNCNTPGKLLKKKGSNDTNWMILKMGGGYKKKKWNRLSQKKQADPSNLIKGEKGRMDGYGGGAGGGWQGELSCY